MTARTELAGIDRLLIDGNNLLHRVSGSVDPGAQRALLARLRGALPAEVQTTLMLDGHAAAGTDRRQRVSKSLEIHHAGSLTADEALLNIVRDQPQMARAAITLVTDDRALTDKARHLGARTKRLEWLEQLMEPGQRPAGQRPQIGIGRGGRPPPQARLDSDGPEREPWRPGRGATRKRGNPRRGRPESG